MKNSKISVISSNRLHKVSPVLYGLFYEDISFAADGGLYSELVSNRSFEFFDRTEKNSAKEFNKMMWEVVGKAELEIQCENPRNNIQKHYAFLKADEQSGIKNLGFCKEGFAVKENQSFKFMCYAKAANSTRLALQMADNNGRVFCTEEITVEESQWTKYEVELVATDCSEEVFLEILLLEAGEIYFDFISLSPRDTYKNRENGLRADLVEMLADIKPKFMRFPGGCIVEGRSFSNMYNWKETIGDITERRVNWNRWQMEEYQPHKKDHSEYYQSFGIGYYEYFLLCEDIGAKPVPVMNVGMTCQWHESLLIPLDEIQPWIDDILDLIEFCNGSVESKWGKVRAELGHPEPFDLEYIAIGNEQWGEVYFERYEVFQKAISEKHPEIKLITSAGWTAEGKDFDYAVEWMKANKEKAFAVDEHFYKSPEWFLENISRYDNYDRTMPKIFAGEYAAHTKGEILERKNNWYSALTEAAFLTGVERNSDHVVMSCYAPLLARSGHQQWQPNLIWFNKTQVVGTANYYVQKLFSNLVGDEIIETKVDDMDLQVVSSSSEDGKRVIIKVVNLSSEDKKVCFDLDREVISCGVNTICQDLEDENTYEAPKKVYPQYVEMNGFENEQVIKGYSLVIYDLKVN